MTTPTPYWQSSDGRLTLYHHDAVLLLKSLDADSVDVVNTDPPYFLSGGGQTCHAGQRAKVDKGTWDKPMAPMDMLAFNQSWLVAAQRVLKKTGSLWASGSHHNFSAMHFASQVVGLRTLNTVAWEKPNPPPNLACRSFTHSTEMLLWASKNAKARHLFNYAAMKAVTGKQMKDVWRMAAPSKAEKVLGKYPAQKPVGLHQRIYTATAPTDGLVVDPFCGSGSSGVAAASLGLRWIGVDLSTDALELAVKRLTSVEVVGSCSATVDDSDSGVEADDVRSALCELYRELSPETWLEISQTDPLHDAINTLDGPAYVFPAGEESEAA